MKDQIEHLLKEWFNLQGADITGYVDPQINSGVNADRFSNKSEPLGLFEPGLITSGSPWVFTFPRDPWRFPLFRPYTVAGNLT